jgi:uncharacterized Tic20 family protein
MTETPTETSTVQTAEDKQANTWGMLCHLTALGVFIIPFFGHIIGPLVVWLLKRHDYPLVDEEGKESLNFQISMTIYALVASVLVFLIVGIFLLIGLAIADVILVIIASIKTSNREKFRYPLTIKFLK